MTKSLALAYVLWLFLGLIGVHRIYLGRVGSGVTMLILTLLAGVFSLVPILGWIVALFVLVPVGVWWIVDVFLIPGIAKNTAKTTT